MAYLVDRYRISERRACKLVEQHRSTQRYAAMHGTEEVPLVVTTEHYGSGGPPLRVVVPGASAVTGPGKPFDDEHSVHSVEEEFRPERVERLARLAAVSESFQLVEEAEGAAGGGGAQEPGTLFGIAASVPEPSIGRAVVDVVVSTGRIPLTVMGGFARLAADSSSACVASARSTAVLFVRLVPPCPKRMVQHLGVCRRLRP